MDLLRREWDELKNRPFPRSGFASDDQRVELASADSFAAGCIVSFIDTGSLDNARIAVLKGCLSDIERELPALSAAAKDYFERFSRIGKSIISQLRETR